MLAYIIRLDDACPTMNADNWVRVEGILDAYNIKPIVGIIPDSKNSTFNWRRDDNFWEITAARYRDKNWTIAQHGCHHLFQSETKGEFVGLSYNEQKALIEKGYWMLWSHGLVPICFFAPAHKFDNTTVAVIRDSGCFEFISDGNALFQYKYRDVLFIPAFWGTPHAIFPTGIFTFVLHPNTMSDKDIKWLDYFAKKHKDLFVDVNDILKKIDKNRPRGFIDRIFASGVTMLRYVRSL